MRGLQAIAFTLLATATASATPQRPPPSPAIAGGTRTFVAFGGAPAPVRLAWTPQPNIERYRARWTDAGVQIDIELPGSATAFERAEATAGRHQLSVVAIDADGRESPPAEIAVEVVTVNAIVAGTEEPTTPSGSAFVIGARFASPGLSCRLGLGTPATEVIATMPGTTLLACGGEAGQPRVEIPLVIVPVRVAGPIAPIVREHVSRVHVTVAAVAPIGDKLVVEAIGDLDLGDAERTEYGLDVPVTARPGSTTAGLVVRAGTVELGRVTLALTDAVVSQPEEVDELAWYALDVGGQVGAFIPPQDGLQALALGDPADSGEAVTSGALVGGRLGFFPTRHVGLEAEAALGMAGYTKQPGQALFGLARVQLATRLVDEQRYGLRLLAGVDLIGMLSQNGASHRDATGGVHYGAAFTIETRPNLWLRIEGLDVITAARDAGYAHCVELQVGVVTRFGRQDRWW